jgi:hypothetical protein
MIILYIISAYIFTALIFSVLQKTVLFDKKVISNSETIEEIDRKNTLNYYRDWRRKILQYPQDVIDISEIVKIMDYETREIIWTS